MRSFNAVMIPDPVTALGQTSQVFYIPLRLPIDHWLSDAHDPSEQPRYSLDHKDIACACPSGLVYPFRN